MENDNKILQQQLLVRGLTNRSIATDIMGKNVLALFNGNQQYQDIANTLVNHYNKTKDPLTLATLKQELSFRLERQIKVGKRTSEDLDNLYKLVDTLGNTAVDSSETMTVMLNKYMRTQLSQAAILQAAQEAEGNPEYDLPEAVSKHMDNINLLDVSGHQSDVIHMYKDHEVKEELYSTLFQQQLKTGLPSLDKALGGGLARGEMGMVIAPSGKGKALDMDTDILTPNGVVKNGDLKEGDYVYNRLGKPVKILGIYDQGELDEYKVTTDDGRTIYCNDEHLFSYWSISGSRNLSLVTKTLKEMIDTGLSKTNSKGVITHRYSIPTSSALEFPEQDLPVKPYTLGALIGDGSLTGKPLYISASDEKLPVLDRIVAENGWASYKRNSPSNYTYTFKYPNNPKRKNVHTSDLDLPKEVLHHAKDKHIPEKYKIGSKKQRLELLQGLFDTDGSVFKRKGSNTIKVNFSSTSAKLVEDMVYILRSLGYKATSRVRQRDRKLKNGDLATPEWNINVNGTLEMLKDLFSVPFKLARFEGAKAITSYHDRARIVSAEPTGRKVPMRCIYVDDEEHLYVAGDFIVTHNTQTLANLAVNYTKQGYNVFFVALEETSARMGIRFDRLVGKLAYSDIINKQEEAISHSYQNLIKAYQVAEKKHAFGDLAFFRRSPRTTTIDEIQQVVLSTEHKTGIHYDCIIVDYPDLLLSNYGNNASEAEQGGKTYEDVRRVGQQLDAVMWVASQVNRTSNMSEVINAYSIEGSYRKLNAVEFAMTLNQTHEEFEEGYVRFYLDKIRNRSDGYKEDMLHFKYEPKSLTLTEESDSDRFKHKAVLENHTKIQKTSNQAKFGKTKAHENDVFKQKEAAPNAFNTKADEQGSIGNVGF